ncbi:receptor-type tyrosine-protein phosphatase gamma [Silurus meridionalis]|nr:receptor-type tyrosine-protein phosphatase gamma [Silurus meridionalis]
MLRKGEKNSKRFLLVSSTSQLPARSSAKTRNTERLNADIDGGENERRASDMSVRNPHRYRLLCWGLSVILIQSISSHPAVPPRTKHGRMSNQREKRAAGEPYWAYSGTRAASKTCKIWPIGSHWQATSRKPGSYKMGARWEPRRSSTEGRWGLQADLAEVMETDESSTAVFCWAELPFPGKALASAVLSYGACDAELQISSS